MPDDLIMYLACDVLGARFYWRWVIDNPGEFELDVWINAMAGLGALGL
jgi:hypothetical protein